MELDQRTDGAILQAILKRLTGRGTVPNVIVQVFPSNDLVVLRANGTIRRENRLEGPTT